MIDWKKHKEEILFLSTERGGSLSSSQIHEKLISDGLIPRTPGGDRRIRQYIRKNKDEKRNLKEVSPKKNKKPKVQPPANVLVFDIETLPGVGYFWNRWNANISEDHIIKSWCVLGWSAKWLFEDKVHSSFLTPEEVAIRDDKRIMKNLWGMLDEADIVIAHNGVKFDMRAVTGRFFLHDMSPHSSVKMIDILRHLRGKMKLESNKLDSVAQALGLKGKIKTNFDLWRDCDNGDVDALHKMELYCEQDVRVLEDVYFALRPYIRPHPNMGLHINDGTHHCPTCGSENISSTGNDYLTPANAYEEYRCADCGSLSRSRNSSIDSNHKKYLLL